MEEDAVDGDGADGDGEQEKASGDHPPGDVLAFDRCTLVQSLWSDEVQAAVT